jgi:hypothetical protein
MTTIVIDDSGRAWDAGSQTLRAIMHCPFPDFEFLEYVVDNLGFVVVTTLSPRAVRIRFRPKVVSHVSLGAALFRLAERRDVDRIVVSHRGKGCNDELFGSLKQAVVRIEELISSARNSDPPAFVNAEREVRTLIGANNALSWLLRSWIEHDVCDPSILAELLHGRLHGRYMLVEGDRLTMAEIGPGFPSYDPDWRERARGLTIENQPDYAYGRWTGELFKVVLEKWRPRLDDIDALIRRPSHRDIIRVRYRCLLLPYRSGPSGLPSVLSASIIDESIDFRADKPQTGASLSMAGQHG